MWQVQYVSFHNHFTQLNNKRPQDQEAVLDSSQHLYIDLRKGKNKKNFICWLKLYFWKWNGHWGTSYDTSCDTGLRFLWSYKDFLGKCCKPNNRTQTGDLLNEIMEIFRVIIHKNAESRKSVRWRSWGKGGG